MSNWSEFPSYRWAACKYEILQNNKRFPESPKPDMVARKKLNLMLGRCKYLLFIVSHYRVKIMVWDNQKTWYYFWFFVLIINNRVNFIKNKQINRLSSIVLKIIHNQLKCNKLWSITINFLENNAKSAFYGTLDAKTIRNHNTASIMCMTFPQVLKLSCDEYYQEHSLLPTCSSM
jgi:hypothetical protein